MTKGMGVARLQSKNGCLQVVAGMMSLSGEGTSQLLSAELTPEIERKVHELFSQPKVTSLWLDESTTLNVTYVDDLRVVVAMKQGKNEVWLEVARRGLKKLLQP